MPVLQELQTGEPRQQIARVSNEAIHRVDALGGGMAGLEKRPVQVGDATARLRVVGDGAAAGQPLAQEPMAAIDAGALEQGGQAREHDLHAGLDDERKAQLEAHTLDLGVVLRAAKLGNVQARRPGELGEPGLVEQGSQALDRRRVEVESRGEGVAVAGDQPGGVVARRVEHVPRLARAEGPQPVEEPVSVLGRRAADPASDVARPAGGREQALAGQRHRYPPSAQVADRGERAVPGGIRKEDRRQSPYTYRAFQDRQTIPRPVRMGTFHMRTEDLDGVCLLG
jgi:hypothetical protein